MHSSRFLISSACRTRTWFTWQRPLIQIDNGICACVSKPPRPGSAFHTTTIRTYSRRHPARHTEDTKAEAVSELRRKIMDEYMIPGRYKSFFKPDKRTKVKMEEPLIRTAKSRSTRKVPAKTAATTNFVHAGDTVTNVGRDASEKEITTTLSTDGESSHQSSTSSSSSTRQGRQTVGWRALEEMYAHEVLPHPYIGKAYLDIVQVKLLDDGKTYQFWYRPIPTDSVSSDDIANEVTRHAPALRAMLARHAYHHAPGAKRLSFQFVRQSDRIASMDQLWKQLEEDLVLSENKLHNSQEHQKEKQ
ncbi:hypothetical protein BGW41_000462 [Actinomortierella wolfii]|nr:hypothetical protein BGW41_000462 [Actinomortierella wolfii]